MSRLRYALVLVTTSEQLARKFRKFYTFQNILYLPENSLHLYIISGHIWTF